jgi:TolB-like protein/tetratricopeptide (TPR) repeat protein
MLVRRAGEIVTRQELTREVWGADTFVDFDQGLNYAIRRIRAALDDDAEAPRFVETVPKTGYRFLAQITLQTPGAQPGAGPADAPAAHPRRHLTRSAIAALVLISVLILAGVISWKYRARQPATVFAGRPTSLAVLPLRNLSADSEQEYFSEGMTDELITDLAKSTGIRVISHTSVERYKNTSIPLPQIARELGVDAVVEGTVARAGNRVRITTQLIDARSDTHLWADSYERDATDTLSIQDALARDIATKIRGTVLSVREVRQPGQRPVPPGALDSYMRGRYLWSQRDPQTLVRAKEYFQDAARQAPEFALAYSGLGDCYWMHGAGFDLKLAEQYDRKALSLDPQLAEAHASLGVVLLLQRRFGEAQPELLRAIELNPSYAMAHHWYSAYLLARGLPEDALAENDRAQRLDPFGIRVNSIRTVIFIDSHRYDEALVQAAKLAELSPVDSGAYSYMARIYWLQGRVPEAFEAAKKEGAAKHHEAWVREWAELQEFYKHAGPQATMPRVPQLMAKHQDPVAAMFEYANLRNSAKVLELLNANWDDADISLEIKTAPELDFLRLDPRFLEVEHRVHPDQ